MNEIILEIQNLLRTTLGSTYKKYYFGEIKVPNQSYLPFLEIIPDTSRLSNRGTGGMMNNEFQIKINLKNTLKKYLKQDTNVETLEHVQDLVKKMEKRTNGNLDPDCIVGVLHNNLQLSNADIVDNWEIAYDEIDLGESYITLGTVTFTVKMLSN